MQTRRLTVTLATALAALATTAPGALAQDARPLPVPEDHLTVTVAHTGDPATDGTYELFCHPAGGSHPDPKGACDGVDEVTTWGKQPFAPVPKDTKCTMQYGGPATAHVSGSWNGRPVDASFDRADGCEIHRWDTLVPLLPRLPR